MLPSIIISTVRERSTFIKVIDIVDRFGPAVFLVRLPLITGLKCITVAPRDSSNTDPLKLLNLRSGDTRIITGSQGNDETLGGWFGGG